MNSLDAILLLDDVADAMADATGRRRSRADAFLTTMHERGWRIVRGEPVITRPGEPAEATEAESQAPLRFVPASALAGSNPPPPPGEAA